MSGFIGLRTVNLTSKINNVAKVGKCMKKRNGKQYLRNIRGKCTYIRSYSARNLTSFKMVRTDSKAGKMFVRYKRKVFCII